MKKIYLFATLVLAICFSACSDEDYNEGVAPPQSYPQENEQTVDGFTFTLGSAFSSALAITEEDINGSAAYEAIVATATPTLSEGASVTYLLELSTTNDFSDSVSVVSLSENSAATISASELNTAVKTLYGGAATERALYLRATFYITEGTSSVLMPNPVILGAFTVTPYATIKEPLYMVGNLVTGLPGWANNVDAIGNGLQVLFADNSFATNQQYTYTATFSAGGEAKFPVVAGAWDPSWGLVGTELTLANGTDNIVGPATAGIYTMNVDLVAKTYEFVPYTGTVTTYTTIGVIGDATAGGWDADTDLTQVAPHIWTGFVTLTKGSIKFRENNDWAISWGAPEDTNQVPYAHGTTDNGKNITIDVAGEYYVALDDLTGHYIVIPKSDLP